MYIKTDQKTGRRIALGVAAVAALALGTPIVVHAVGISTPLSTPAPSAGGAPLGPPPAIVESTAPAVRGPGYATVHGLFDLERNPSLIKNGCADVNSIHVCVPALTVDGQATPPTRIIEKVLAAITAPDSPPGLSPGGSQVLQGAVAATVLEELLNAEASTYAISVSEAQATALAQQQLDLYHKDPAAFAAAGAIPAGMSADAFFSSPTTVAAYQRLMTIQQAKAHLLTAAPARTDPHTVLSQWMNQVLPRHSVQVDGGPPDFTLAASLPAQP